jgi:hypothetical protein
VRFLIGDTDPNRQLLQDGEINYNLVLVNGSQPPPANGNFLSASHCAEALSARYARSTDKSVGDLHISYGKLQKQYQALAITLRSRAALSSVPFYVGGLSKAEKQSRDADVDLLGTAVRTDGMSLTESLGQESDSHTGV